MKRSHSFAAFEFTLIALFIGGCASGPAPQSSLPGTTMATPQLERDTVALVLGIDRIDDCTCNQRKIINREIGSRSVEYWTVDRCGTLLRYTITYSPSPRGGTLILLDPSPEVVRQGAVPLPPWPKMFEDVWYRAGDRGLSLRAYSASGKIVISEQSIAFGENGDAFEISTSDIKSVCWGKMEWDTVNEWVIIRYGSPEKMAGFKDGSRLGWGTRTPEIMSALSYVLKKRPVKSKH